MYVGGRLSWACCLLSLFFSSAVGDRVAYLGCYHFSYENMRGDLKEFPTGLTPEVCMEYCKDRAFPFAGLQFSSKCVCGDKAPILMDKRQDSDCNMKCTGDPSQMCGGDWRNSVYISGYTEALIVDSRYDYQGCYVDQDSRELSGHFQDLGEKNSPESCITLCKEKGFKFAGLQYRTQCFCGNEEPRLEKRVDQQECKAKCSGDKRFNCGSDWRNNVYKTNRVQREQSVFVSAEITSKYKGCYVDEDSDRRLIGDFKDFGNSLTPQACIDYCKNKGQPFAGTQHSSLCFCGEVSPSPKDASPKGDCNAKCSGDQSQNCGGTWRNSIYETGFAAPSIAELPGYEYVGCYRDQGDPRLLRGYLQNFLDSLTPQLCVAICKGKNLKYAGLQASNQCWCGNEDLPASAKVSDSDCSLKCLGDRSFFCGGYWRNSIYKTSNSDNNAEEAGCIKSVTRVNGKAACQNEVVFEDNFDRLSPENWSHIIQIAMRPDYQFVIYNSDNANSYISNGKLAIKPTLLPDTEVRHGDLHLQNCTGKTDAGECGYKAISYKILPPVLSARLTTRKSFNFLYGKVEISAKLPAGDWLVPEIWLEPTNEVYGPGYTSGRVRIAMTRGNSDLKLNGNDIGYKQLETGVLLGLENDVRQHTMLTQTVDGYGWPNEYHKYSVIWTPESLRFMVDDEQVHSVMPNRGQSLSASVGLTPDVTFAWSASSKLAPFNKDFYISLGVSAGGFRDFADNIANSQGRPKPWKNLNPKAMASFWRDKASWQSTWHDDTALLQVDYIKVTAL